MVCSYKEILYSKEKAQTTATCNTMNESHKKNVKQKKLDTKEVFHLHKLQNQAKPSYSVFLGMHTWLAKL